MWRADRPCALIELSRPSVVQVFNSVTTFDKWFNAPFESYKVVSKEEMALTEEEQMYLISRLHSVLEPFMLRYAIGVRQLCS